MQLNMSAAEQRRIRDHWAQYDLRFNHDGTVLARRKGEPGGAWGKLYTPQQTASHLQALRN